MWRELFTLFPFDLRCEARDVPRGRKWETFRLSALIHYLRFVLRGFRCFCALFCVLRFMLLLSTDMNMSWMDRQSGKRVQRGEEDNEMLIIYSRKVFELWTRESEILLVFLRSKRIRGGEEFVKKVDKGVKVTCAWCKHRIMACLWLNWCDLAVDAGW